MKGFSRGRFRLYEDWIMRYWLMIMLMASLPALAAPADTADTPQTRKEAAERYAKVSDVRKLMTDTVEAMAQRMPDAQREGFRTLMITHVRPEVLEAAMMAAMRKHFTTRELNALADFYDSEEGRSAMAKFGRYMADVMPLIQAEIARAFAEYQREQASKPAKSGT